MVTLGVWQLAMVAVMVALFARGIIGPKTGPGLARPRGRHSRRKFEDFRAIGDISRLLGIPARGSYHRAMDKSDYQLTRKDRRSLAFHTAIAEKLRHNPAPVVAKGRANLARLSALHTNRAALLDQAFARWDEWLDLAPETLAEKITGEGEMPVYMRHVSVFAGVLSPDERNRIIRSGRREPA